jgi:hypothetical protein
VTALTAVPSFASTTPTISVADVTGISVGDLLLVGDYSTAYLFKVSAVPAASGAMPQPGNLSLGVLGAAPVPPSPVPALAIGSPVMKAASYSFFVAPAAAGSYQGMLMVDASGVASSNHLDWGNTVQPAVEGVVDFQVAIGNDANQDGVVTENTGAPATDEWIGNATGETLGVPPWNAGAGTPQPKQVRLTFLLRTVNAYGGALPNVTPAEDRPLASYPTYTGVRAPRYRVARTVVAPRAWNLAE